MNSVFGSLHHLRMRLQPDKNKNQRTNGPVNAHLISWPSKAQNIQNLEKYMVKTNFQVTGFNSF